MSDSQITYREIRKFLEKLYPVQPKGNLARHLNTLAAIISGIIGSKDTQLPKIADGVPGEAKTASIEKRIKRWIDNDRIEWDVYFLPFAQALLLNMGLPEIVLAIDGSAVGRGCAALMINVIYKKRAIPLACAVIKGEKGHFPEKIHIAMAEEIHKMIPESGQQVVFLGDGEFDGTGLQKTLNGWGWLYVCRTGKNIRFFWDDMDFSMDDLGSIISPGHYLHAEDVLFTHKKYGPVTVIAWRGDNNKEPIYLVTNMRSPDDACDYYSKRFRIETFFSDQKSRGFNIHKSHLSDPERLRRLMIGACLAYIWIILLGIFAVKHGWTGIIHRTDRCDLSLFQLGLKLLKYLLKKDIPIPVIFI